MITRHYKDAGDAYMAEVMDNGGNLQSFEVNHAVQAIMDSGRLTEPMKQIIATKLQASIQSGNMGNANTHQAYGRGQYSGGNMAATTGQVAEFSIIVQRNSSNIATALPIALFMPDFLTNNYQSILSNFIAQISPGTTLASVVVNPTFIRFTFVNGAFTDQVDIFCDTSPYPSFLSAMNTQWFKTIMMRMELNNQTTVANTDSDASRQFKVAITPYFDTSFGAFGGNRCPLTNCKPPNQFLKNVIDIPWAQFAISPRQGWIFPVINAANRADVLNISIAHPVQELTRTSAGQ